MVKYLSARCYHKNTRKDFKKVFDNSVARNIRIFLKMKNRDKKDEKGWLTTEKNIHNAENKQLS